MTEPHEPKRKPTLRDLLQQIKNWETKTRRELAAYEMAKNLLK